MQRRAMILLLCLLLVLGAASDRYRQQTAQRTPDGITVTAPFTPQYTANLNPQSSVDTVAALSGISRFSKQYQTSGASQKIALIDSGIDLQHSAFQRQSTKVPIYRDFTQEGKLTTRIADYVQGELTVGGTIYQIGKIVSNQPYRLTFLPLHTMQPRVFPEAEQQMAVLVIASAQDYDCVYLDTDQDCDFSDEQPLYCHAQKRQSVTVHGAGCGLNLALTSLAADGTQLQLTADTLGHGTFLAGLVAADSPAYKGLAPQAQLCIYKIFDRDGQSSQVLLARAIRQAILDEVDVINLSLSIPQSDAVSDQLREVFQQARAANIPVVVAAGNYGPGQNTMAYPAREPSVIGVGSYADPKLYALDRDIFLEQVFIPDYSGRGNRDGANCPLFVAPSGMISTVPGWYSESYLYDYGTSISAAIATAAVAHLQEALDRQNLLLSVEQMKNLLADWAQDLQYPTTAQGYGALHMGQLPRSAEAIVQRQGMKSETVIYTAADSLAWQFTLPQGQCRHWYIQVPPGCQRLSAVAQLATQQPENGQEHLVVLGRCQISLYDPEGQLVDQTAYFGAAYSQDMTTSSSVEQRHPQAGVWEIVLNCADNLSQYNQLESNGILQINLE